MVRLRVHYFAVMVTGMHFLKFQDLRKALTKEKREKKNVNDFFIAVVLHFCDLNYLNYLNWIKNRSSNKKSGMVPK